MEIKVDTKKAEEKLQKLQNLGQGAFQILRVWLTESVRELKKRARDMKKVYWRKTGKLAQSAGGKTLVEGKQIRTIIGSGVFAPATPYARIQDEGGKVKPKRAKNLTVPFEGVKGWAREYQNTFVRKNIIFQKTGKKSIRPLFSLKKEVDIPASKWFSATMEKKKQELFSKLGPEALLRANGISNE